MLVLNFCGIEWMGYRIFALCAVQLRNNWQIALKISWFWWSLLTIAGLLMPTNVTPADSEVKTTLLLVAFSSLTALVGGTIIAIAWHRYVLREEIPGNLLIFPQGWPIGLYILNVFKCGFLMMVILLPLLFAFALTPHGLQGGLGNLLSIFLGVLFTWMFLRIGLVFPAIAVGQHIKIRDAFQMTSALSSKLLVTAMLLVAVQTVPAVLQYLLGVLAGGDMSTVLLPVSLLFSWINLFLSVGVLTVLYGHLCEGRPI